MQKLGVDVALSASTGEVIYVDEKVKCTSSISQQMVAKQSVEILQDADNPSKLGWWVNQHELTHLYAYINLSSDNKHFWTLQPS